MKTKTLEDCLRATYHSYAIIPFKKDIKKAVREWLHQKQPSGKYNIGERMVIVEFVKELLGELTVSSKSMEKTRT